jgi:hypothetical protein
MKILYVEDNEDNVYVLKSRLTRAITTQTLKLGCSVNFSWCANRSQKLSACPRQGGRSARLIADVISECVRGEDGTWRFRSHVVQPVFLGSDHPLSLAIDGQFLSRPSERIAR